MRNKILNHIARAGLTLIAVTILEEKERVTYTHKNGKVYEVVLIKRHRLNK